MSSYFKTPRNLCVGLLFSSSRLSCYSDAHRLFSSDRGGPRAEVKGHEDAAFNARIREGYLESVASVARSLAFFTKREVDARWSDFKSIFVNEKRQREVIRKIRSKRRRRARHDSDRNLIVGGVDAAPGRFPYVVSLQLEHVLDTEESAEYGGSEVADVHTCGGTLIAPDVVLTAAHCSYDELGNGSQSPPKQIFYGADVGAFDLSTNEGGGYTVDNMLFEKLVLHPDYTGFLPSNGKQVSLQHDVMLVKLYGAADQPVVTVHNPALGDPPHSSPVKWEELTVVGWGDTDRAPGDSNVALSPILKIATVQYVPNDMCEKSKGYSNIYASTPSTEEYFEYAGTISDDMMCAIGEKLQDACQGDSGGGLFRLGLDSNGADDIQMGIVSWGLECGDDEFPGVYARVGDHFDWISENVCDLSDNPPQYFNCPMKPLPPINQNAPFVDISIVIKFDDYRSETGWVLESIPDFQNIVFRPFGTYKQKNSVGDDNAISETVSVQSGRFYMLSLLDEFADGFCCIMGDGYFRVESSDGGNNIIDTTPGIMWSPHALRRAFYVAEPNDANPPDYITVVVTLGIGADPNKLLLIAVENVMYEALLMYEIRPFSLMNDPRSGGVSYTRTFIVPVFGASFNRQKYEIIIYDDNVGDEAKANFEVYFGRIHPDNLLVAQGSNYGNSGAISRSFVLFKKSEGSAPSSPALETKSHDDDDTRNIGISLLNSAFVHSFSVMSNAAIIFAYFYLYDLDCC